MTREISLYIHIPFCKSKCPYCDFNSIIWDEGLWKAYCSVMKLQAAQLSRKLNKPSCLTIYIGGGTPSVLDVEQLKLLLEVVEKNFVLDSLEEFTLEVNPGDVNSNLLRQWYKLGINRISIGIQSFSENLLKILGRRHSAVKALNSIKEAQDIFGEKISIDLIFNIPGQNLSMWYSDLSKVLSLGLKHVSLYSLTIEKGTKFYDLYGDYDLSSIAVDMYTMADRVLSKSNLLWYEISNFAYPGFESKHNLAYWLGKSFLGLGAGAWSFVDNLRFAASCSVKQYIDCGLKERHFQYTYDKLGVSERRRELLILRLRTKYGLPSFLLSEEELLLMEKFMNRGWIRKTLIGPWEIFCLTLEGRLFADEMAVEIL